MREAAQTDAGLHETVKHPAGRGHFRPQSGLYDKPDRWNVPSVLELRGVVLNRTEQVATEQKLFQTADGYLGLGWESICEQEEVWVLAGGSVPYVLRLCPNGHYRFVGEAVVHGLMNRDAVS